MIFYIDTQFNSTSTQQHWIESAQFRIGVGTGAVVGKSVGVGIFGFVAPQPSIPLRVSRIAKALSVKASTSLNSG